MSGRLIGFLAVMLIMLVVALYQASEPMEGSLDARLRAFFARRRERKAAQSTTRVHE